MKYDNPEISRWPEQEYLAWIESVEYFEWVGEEFLQILVNRFGDNFKVKKLGDSLWHKPSDYGFYPKAKRTVPDF